MNRTYLKKLRNKLKGKFILAVTGVPGSGKSLFCFFLSNFGANYVSSDAIAARLLTKKKCYSKILKEFGKSVSDGNLLNKRKLAEAVFKHKGKRRWLENYLHPFIASEIYSEIKKSKKKITVVEAPLLFESGFDSFADMTVCVAGDLKEIASRLKKRGWTQAQAKDRAAAQLKQKEKAALCDLLVENKGSAKDLERKAKFLIEAIKEAV